MSVRLGGAQAIDTPYVNASVAIRNKAEYSRAYHDQTTSTLFYPDSGATDRTKNTNTGFTSNATLTNAALILPLNKYSFFAASQKLVYPTGKIKLKISFERAENVLHKDGASTEGRNFVTKMRLWVPKRKLNSASRKKCSS